MQSCLSLSSSTGGGFTEGSGAIEVYRRRQPGCEGRVIVTINYRLGVLGFLAYPELTAESEHHASGNYGLSGHGCSSQMGQCEYQEVWRRSAAMSPSGVSQPAHFSVASMVASPLALDYSSEHRLTAAWG